MKKKTLTLEDGNFITPSKIKRTILGKEFELNYWGMRSGLFEICIILLELHGKKAYDLFKRWNLNIADGEIQKHIDNYFKVKK